MRHWKKQSEAEKWEDTQQKDRMARWRSEVVAVAEQVMDLTRKLRVGPLAETVGANSFAISPTYQLDQQKVPRPVVCWGRAGASGWKPLALQSWDQAEAQR